MTRLLCAVLLTLTACAVPAASPAPVVEHVTALPSPLSTNVALGIPRATRPADDIVIDRGAWVAGYSPRHEGPSWVSWRVDRATLGTSGRTNAFRADSLLPEGIYHVTPHDYARTGYDKGHVCPSGDRTDSAEDNAATFLMSNMLPQAPELNRVTWEALERHERELAADGGEVYVTAGGVFGEHPATIGNGVAVPEKMWKVIVRLTAGCGVECVTRQTKPIAVVMPNDETAKARPWTAYAVSVDALEDAAGYDVLTAVPAAIQDVIESEAP